MTQLKDEFLANMSHELRTPLNAILGMAEAFQEEGGIRGTKFSTREPPILCIAVTDTGIGIDSADMSKLFQPFIQIDSALNRQYEGTGLGLSLVKRVEMHGGQIDVSSEVGVGSCFRITLPCWAPLDGHKIPHRQKGSPLSFCTEEKALAPLLLLAEDNEANINTLSSYLQAKGYRLSVAHNGHEAIATLRDQRPDLIVMDIQMPQMDALTAIEQIRQNPDWQDIPIIALTSLAMKGDRDRCLAAGANEYLSKPVKLKV